MAMHAMASYGACSKLSQSTRKRAQLFHLKNSRWPSSIETASEKSSFKDSFHTVQSRKVSSDNIPPQGSVSQGVHTVEEGEWGNEEYEETTGEEVPSSLKAPQGNPQELAQPSAQSQHEEVVIFGKTQGTQGAQGSQGQGQGDNLMNLMVNLMTLMI